MQSADLEVIKEIPGYKLVLKAVLKHQIQQLVEQLADHTGEESVILTASVSDGSLSHLGTESGKIFLDDNDDIKSKFLGFCLKRYHGQNQMENQQSGPSSTDKTITHSRQRPTPAHRYSTPNQQSSPPVQTGVHPVSLTKVSQRGRKRHKPYVSSQTRRPSLNVNQQAQTSEQQSFPMALPTQPGNDFTNEIDTLEPIKIEIDDEDEKLISDSQSVGLEVPCVLENKSSSLSEDKANKDSTAVNKSNETIAHARNDLDLQSFNVNSAGENMSVNKSVSSDKSVSDNGTPLDPNVHIKTEALESEINLETIGIQSGQISENIWMPNLQTLGAIEPASSSQREMTADPNCNRDRNHYRSKKCFACGICQKQFSTKYRCSFHIRNFHSEAPPLGTVCHFCQKRFSTKANLRSHVSSVHMAEKEHACSSCEKEFSNRKDMESHKRQHHGVPKLTCGKCGRSFGYKSSLTRHRESCGVTKKSHRCSVCDKEFVSRNALYGHRIAKHSSTIHICEICGKSFDRRHSRTRHLKEVHKKD